jgi:uncharacterized protein (DUF1684 family)
MLSLILGFTLASQPHVPDGYDQQIATWRAEQAKEVRAEYGWLSVAGLFWLDPGDNSVGSASSCKVALPATVPAKVGTLTFTDGTVTLSADPSANVTVDGKPVTEVTMRSDASGHQTRADIGAVSFAVIERGQRTGIRVWDNDSRERKDFTGLKWYPVKPSYVVKAKYIAYPTPKKIAITSVLGDVTMNDNPGYVEFSVAGKPCRLEAQAAGSGFFFNFQDTTNGKETFDAGRFLDAPAAKDGFVVLDFNKATNPPCAYTTFATCPLPPKGNSLDVPIKAGEKLYHQLP